LKKLGTKWNSGFIIKLEKWKRIKDSFRPLGQYAAMQAGHSEPGWIDQSTYDLLLISNNQGTLILEVCIILNSD